MTLHKLKNLPFHFCLGFTEFQMRILDIFIKSCFQSTFFFPFFYFFLFFIIIKKECQQWKTSANKMSLKTGEKLKQLKVKLPFELNMCVYHINHCWHGACNTFFFFSLNFSSFLFNPSFLSFTNEESCICKVHVWYCINSWSFQ